MRLNNHRSIRRQETAEVRKAEFSSVVSRGDLKDNAGAIPLGLVFDKVKLGI
jgi:hypothetical protein